MEKHELTQAEIGWLQSIRDACDERMRREQARRRELISVWEGALTRRLGLSSLGEYRLELEGDKLFAFVPKPEPEPQPGE